MNVADHGCKVVADKVCRAVRENMRNDPTEVFPKIFCGCCNNDRVRSLSYISEGTKKMKYAIISDVHANPAALEKVLADEEDVRAFHMKEGCLD